MDFLKRCSGTNFCHFSKIVQRACFSALAYKGWLPAALNDTRVINVRGSRRLAKTVHLRRLVVSDSKFGSSSASRPNDRVHNPISVEALNADDVANLKNLTDFCFLDGGKLLRPTVVLLMAACCCSVNQRVVNDIFPSQKKVAVISEMIHTASLVHDDVIDESDQRRGRPTISSLNGNKAAILVGDYILAKATQLLTSIGNPDVIILLAQVIEDLVKGEFMQLGSRVTNEDRFAHYIAKTFKKTASLFAHSCKAVALLAECSEIIKDAAFQYGRNLGLAFQIVDDMLDFIAHTAVLGKPAFADLQLGIATAPVLFASLQHPELNELILRRFSKPGDVELACNLVLNSDGISRSKQLAEHHCQEAIQNLQRFPDSPFKNALIGLAQKQTCRER